MNHLMAIFLILLLGYLLGSVSIKGMSLGTSGILLVALVFGHFGVIVPAVIKNFGLAIFVGSVGMIAGPVFFRNFKKKVYAFLTLGVLIVVVGGVVTVALGKLLGVSFDLSIGIFTGALTSTPGLAAATEATTSVLAARGSEASSLASVGYGIAYPFGVVGVVLFVQLYPKLVRCDMKAEVKKLHDSLHGKDVGSAEDGAETPDNRKYIQLDPFGLLSVALTIVLGILLGNIKFPLPGGMNFALGTAGGPLFIGLIVGHFGHVGRISITAPSSTVKVMRELGLCMFLLGAGTEAGEGFIEVLMAQGVKLFLLGIVVTLVPMILACIVSRLIRLDTLTTLGSVCGGMTSTPALGALISSCGTEDVAASYAATYPFALICVVLGAQIMALLW